MPEDLAFTPSRRFVEFVRFLERQKVLRLDGSVPVVLDARALNGIGLGLFLYFVARGLVRQRRVTFLGIDAKRTAVLVEASPGRGIFLRGPADTNYAPVAISSGMRSGVRLCAGDALLRANWSLFGEGQPLPPRLPVCPSCDGVDCATAAWIRARLASRPADARAMTAGHGIIVPAPAACFEALFAEPVDEADEGGAESDRPEGGPKLTSMEVFDAFVALVIAARAKAHVYMPNTKLREPVISPYEYDAVVYRPKIRDLVVVETALGTDDEEELREEEENEGEKKDVRQGRLARRLKRKYLSQAVFAASRLKRFRYVYATVRRLGEEKGEDLKYAKWVFQEERAIRLVELETQVPEIVQLTDPTWWDPAVIRRSYRTFIRDIKAAALGR